MQLEPLGVHQLTGRAIDVLASSLAVRGRHPDVGGEHAVAVGVDRAFAVGAPAGAHADSLAVTDATYSSTHSGRMRRCAPTLTERISRIAINSLVLDNPNPSISATSAGVYHFLANCISIGFPFVNAAGPAAVGARPEGLSTERRLRGWSTWAGRGCMSRVPGPGYTIGCAVMGCTLDPQISG